MTDTDYSRPAVEIAGGSMPLLGFGTWQISDRDAEEAVGFALDAGYRHLDTATMYRNEDGVGRAVRASGLPRDSVFITTKMPPDRTAHARETLETSLGKLGVDQVDLWLIHWPPSGSDSVAAWKEFVRAKDDGLTASIGVSNYSLGQIDDLIEATGVTPAVNQVRWGPSLYDEAFADGLRERGVVLEGYSPFKVTNLQDPTLTSIADARDATTAQVVVAWHVRHGYVVIPKSAQRERIVANAAGALLELTDDEAARIDALG
jgi:2,5-diketo-D-gluconate reductase A